MLLTVGVMFPSTQVHALSLNVEFDNFCPYVIVDAVGRIIADGVALVTFTATVYVRVWLASL